MTAASDHPKAPSDPEAASKPEPKAAEPPKAEATETPAPQPPINGKLANLEAERDRLKAEVKENRDKYLRARADYDNLVRRQTKESQEAVKTAKAGLLLRVIEVEENLEKAVTSLKATQADAQGVKLVLDLVHKLLKDEGVKTIETSKVEFNYAHHMAVERTPTPDHAEGTILEVYQRGYTLADQVLRPAMVRVAAAPQTKPAPGNAATQKTSETDAGASEAKS